MSKDLRTRTAIAGLISLLLLAVFQPLAARETGDDPHRYGRYIVELLDPPLALYDGGDLSVDGPGGPLRLPATSPEASGEARLDPRSPNSRSYLEYLMERHAAFVAEARVLLGREPEISHRYRAATNGLALHLTADEAELLGQSPMVRSVKPDVVYRLDTYAGPEWIGAGILWNGDAGYAPARGEGIVVGNIDTGINWDHPSFDDSNFNYANPYGSGLGLCSEPDVLCNDKLIGVYDFVEDDPSTEDWVEENTRGKDNNGHGSHTASIATGVPVNIFLNGIANETISGVAPRAQLISYRVCFMGEPQTAESEGCQGSAILQAIDQAVSDGVDVINYSIGGDARDPWVGTADRAFLSARIAGIVVTSSAGNTGPNEATVTSPALAPWVVAVGNATHNAFFGSVVENFSGGSLPAPDPMVGASLTDGTGKLQIVHAKDFGNALCGTGQEADFVPSCNSGSSASNPWAGSKPFNGEIVVCDRGKYGRVEKGLNLKLAGAGGYILANTAEFGESIVADNHCLPATHIGKQDGDELRTWLDAGIGHGAQLSGQTLAERDSVADQVNFTSSRGPAVEPVQDTLKPNLIAPGTAIVAAGSASAQSFLSLNGTSMASPHVAGAAALLKSVHPGWNANQLISAIELTATQELATDENGQPATTEQVGAGRPRLGEAANAGLYLDVTGLDFNAANPSIGGDPGSLNLPGLVDAHCKGSCSFTREVTDMMGGGSWTAVPVGFPEGTQVSVSPSSFSLGNGASRTLVVNVDVTSSGIVGDWVSGKIRLSAAGSSDLFLTVSAYSHGGDLPGLWSISADQDSGWTTFGLSGLVALPNATFTAGGLVKSASRTENLTEDPTNDDIYDGSEGTFTHWYDLPNGALWLHARTPSSTAADVDLFVGRDDDGNGFADEWEELCSSTTPQDIERCDLYDLPPGRYWIHVQNWTGGLAQGDNVTLVHAAVEEAGDSGLAASGPGIVDDGAPFGLRVSWDNAAAVPGETWLGAVGIGSDKATPNNVGVIPVEFRRNSFAAPETFPLMDGREHGLALAAGGRHDRMFIDVPPGASSLTVSASGATGAQSDALTLELLRKDFDDAFTEPPFAAAAGNGTPQASASGSGGAGPSVTVSGGVQPGRWYAVLSNGGGAAASVTISADVTFSGTVIDSHRGLWMPRLRPDLGQGYDYNWGGDNRALIWYTYDENGLPDWYIAGAPASNGNIWTTDILRATNDGATQRLVPVGSLSVTQLASDDALFSFTLYGKSGTERMMPLSAPTCPQVNGGPGSYTGIWFRGEDGLGGASVLVNSVTQAQIHYLFDAQGAPRWLFAQDPANNDPGAPEIPMLQFHGYCAVCDAANVGYVEVGTLGRVFDSESAGSWTLDYLFDAPPTGSANRTENISKLTTTIPCQ